MDSPFYRLYDMLSIVKTLLSTLVMYTSTTAAARISTPPLYRRIYRTPKFERMCWVMVVLNSLLVVCLCPFRHLPMSSRQCCMESAIRFSSQCIDFPKFCYVLSASSVLLDVMVPGDASIYVLDWSCGRVRKSCFLVSSSWDAVRYPDKSYFNYTGTFVLKFLLQSA